MGDKTNIYTLLDDDIGPFQIDCDEESSRSPVCYVDDLEDLKNRLKRKLKLLEPDDGEEFHDDTMHLAVQAVDVFFDDEIFEATKAT